MILAVILLSFVVLGLRKSEKHAVSGEPPIRQLNLCRKEVMRTLLGM
jgi:hypothetical protein